jgi:hypothetical protein
MSRAGEYLSIPADYVECLDGLHWSEAGDAVETASGGTFAINREIALFLEGFVSQRPLIHFGFILHLLHLLKRGGTFAALRFAYETANHPARNAGAFCARLCNDVPPLADAPEVLQVWHALMSSCYVATLGGALPVDQPGAAEMPPLGPLTFEERIQRALAPYTDNELLHWFRQGQGPVKEAAQAVAQAITDLRPRSLSGLLAVLAQRERLAGAVPFVSQLVSALTLPPRRLTHHELPMGGYADVTTRGHPEQVLPSQLAVDELEFVRRFAENELLYFRREEPHARLREELVVLLDQGVRTWGTVRLVLSAALFAFGKLAGRRKLPFQIATTSTDGRLTDPLELDNDALGALVEASDLSPQPALALERVLEEPADTARDVMLLTHPRSLREAEMSAAARRVPPVTRLFAVTVDEPGNVELSEIRHGTPVSLTRLRVDLRKNVAKPKRPKPAEIAPAILPATPWTGAVEAIGYPFRFGLPGQILDGRFEFDGSGNWLLIACQRGMLYAMRTDGSGVEVLPRGVIDGKALLDPDAILGVAGGFVVAGLINDHLVAFHYDLADRTCRAHRLGAAARLRWMWHYIAPAHSIVARAQNAVNGFDLGTREVFSSAGGPFHPKNRVQEACKIALNSFPSPGLSIFHLPTAHFPVHAPAVNLNPESGRVAVHDTPAWEFTPLADGQPALRGASILHARYHGNTLALLCQTQHSRERFRMFLYRRPDGVLLHESHHRRRETDFALSLDGRLLAIGIAARSIQVHDVHNVGTAARTVYRGKFHPNVEALLGAQGLLAGLGNFKHLIRWGGGRLEHRQVNSLANWDFPPGVTKRPHQLMLWSGPSMTLPPERIRRLDCLRPDPRRFISLHEGPLIVLVDCFGQIALLDRQWNLACMFFVFRSQFAAWMPDGTRLGPASLTGGPETPGAAEKIGRRLQEAWGFCSVSQRSWPDAEANGGRK